MARYPTKRTGAGAINSPASELLDITPDDATDLDDHIRALTATSSGVVRVTAIGNEDGTSHDVYVSQGTILPIQVKRVWSTGTTATGIVGIL